MCVSVKGLRVVGKHPTRATGAWKSLLEWKNSPFEIIEIIRALCTKRERTVVRCRDSAVLPPPSPCAARSGLTNASFPVIPGQKQKAHGKTKDRLRRCFSLLESQPLKKEHRSRNKGGYCEPGQMMMNIGADFLYQRAGRLNYTGEKSGWK